jgi:hypothetical protein
MAMPVVDRVSELHRRRWGDPDWPDPAIGYKKLRVQP